MKNITIILLYTIILTILSCNSSKNKLSEINLQSSQNNITASITCNPLDSFTLIFAIENHTNQSIGLGAGLSADNHDIVIHYPNGILYKLPTGSTGRRIKLEAGEAYSYPDWVFGHAIIINPNIDSRDINNFKTGIYHITWKNERLGFSTSYDYYFDYLKVIDRL